MDSMEINKLVGAAVGALLIFLGANFFSDLFYLGGEEGHGEEHYAYAIDTASEGAPKEAAPKVDFQALMASADASKGEKIFNKCKACHKIEPGANATGPSLYGVVGRKVGTEAGFSYSSAMEGHGGEWTPENIFHFLESPRDYVPGTKMGFAGLKKPEDRVDVIAYLESVAKN